jgi:hypothetical protein
MKSSLAQKPDGADFNAAPSHSSEIELSGHLQEPELDRPENQSTGLSAKIWQWWQRTSSHSEQENWMLDDD